jgi:hypothetical protein
MRTFDESSTPHETALSDASNGAVSFSLHGFLVGISQITRHRCWGRGADLTVIMVEGWIENGSDKHMIPFVPTSSKFGRCCQNSVLREKSLLRH